MDRDVRKALVAVHGLSFADSEKGSFFGRRSFSM